MPQHKSYIGIKNEANSDTLELHFTDYIYDGFNWDTWEMENLVQNTIDKIKAANPSKIKVVINSLGGDVMIGLALYNYLKAHAAEKEVEIIGFAASIASVIAMCASKGKLKMAKNSFMIIHAAWSYAAGNATEIRKQADDLDKVTNELADIYAQRSGKTAKHFTDLWAGGDYWMTGTEAKEMGLVDELMNTEPVNAKVDFSAFNFKNIPAGLIQASAEPTDNKNFFQNLNTQFMKFFDTLKASISGAKEDKDKKFDKVENREAILDMVQQVLQPFAKALDDAAKKEEEAAKTDDTKKDDSTGTKTEDKKDDKKEEEKKEEPSAEAKKIAALEEDIKKLRASIAADDTKPKDEKADKSAALMSKVKVEYAAE